jgi:uncharacterized membrane protein
MRKRGVVDTFVLLILVIGLVIFGYLTYVHFNSNALYCPETGVINCGRVLDSPYAAVLGIPIAIGGLAWMAVAIVFEFYQKKRLRGVWSFLALGGACYSIVAMFMIGKICVYCSTADAILLLYFALRVGNALE